MGFADGWSKVSKLRVLIKSYSNEAIDYARAWTVAEKVILELVLREELIETLEADDELDTAFHNLTPGRKKLCNQPQFC